MARSAPRILTYFALACICYFIGMSLGARMAAAVFFVLGGILELMFWMNLFAPKRTSEGSESNGG